MPHKTILLPALLLAGCSSPCQGGSQAPAAAQQQTPSAQGSTPDVGDPLPGLETSPTAADGSTTTAGDAPAPDLRTVEGFWSAFRQAALSNDVAALAALTRFPLTTRGSMDDCPEVQHSREAFDELWPQLLRTDPGLGHNENMRGLIQRLSEVPDNEMRTVERSGGLHLRMGDFEFRRSDTSEELRFSYAYWSADGC